MTTRISIQHNEDRLAGTLFNLQRGAGVARLRVYSAGLGPGPERPADPADAPVGVLMAEFFLADPEGTIAGNKLTLALPPNAVLLADGALRWARYVNRNGDTTMDVDVGSLDGTVRPDAEVKFEQVIGLVAGGALRLLSAEVG